MARTSTDLSRREVVASIGAAALLVAAAGARAEPAITLEVWKDPSCGCCKEWVSQMEANGFRAIVHDTGNNAMRARLGIERRHGSCHTAVVGGYAIEGHVPAADVRRLLRDKPDAIGLAVPGMVVGTPGMDGPDYDGRKNAFDVLLLAKDGSTRIYRHYEGKKA